MLNTQFLACRNSVMLLDNQDSISLHEGNLGKANSLPYGSRLSVVNTTASEVSTASNTKDSLIYSMIAGGSPGGPGGEHIESFIFT